MRNNLAVAILFSLVATLCDRVWIDAGTAWYPKIPPTQVQPLWAPMLFALAALAAVHFAKLVTRRVIASAIPPRDFLAHFAVSAALFVSAFIACGLWDETRARRLSAILFVVWVLWFVLQTTRSDERIALIVIAAALAIAGPLLEIALIRIGVYRYERPFLLGVPLWLPGLWAYAAFLCRDVARAWFGGR